MIEFISSFVAKKAVGNLIKISIEQFNKQINNSNISTLDDLIENLKNEITLELKQENYKQQTEYSLDNLHNFYKLSKAFEKKSKHEDILGTSNEEQENTIHQIEIRLNTLIDEKEIGVIYSYLSSFYIDKNFNKANLYNIKALHCKENLSKVEKAHIYKRQAEIELAHGNNKKALNSIEEALDIESDNIDFLMLEIEIFLQGDAPKERLEYEIKELINKLTEEDNKMKLTDSYTLMAKYYQKNENKEQALINFKNAYNIIENINNKVCDTKKSYLLTNISLLKNDSSNFDEDTLIEASEAIKLQSLKDMNTRDRLYCLESAFQLHKKGIYYYEKREYKKALRFYNKAMEIREKILGEKHQELIIIYHYLGLLYIRLNKNKKAITFFEKALNIWEKVRGENHEGISSLHAALGRAYILDKKNDKASFYLKKAFEKKIFRQNHYYRDLAASYNVQGKIYKETQKYNDALIHFEKAVNIMQKEFQNEYYKFRFGEYRDDLVKLKKEMREQ